MLSVPCARKRQSVKKKQEQDKLDKEKGVSYIFHYCIFNTACHRVAPTPIDPYKQQKVLINTLTNYLNRLAVTTISLPNHSSSVDSSGDEITAQVAQWDTDQGSFLQKKVDQDDKVVTSGGGKRKAKRERKKAVVAVNKV